MGGKRRLEKIGLLRLGRHAGGGAAALDVDAHQRQLGDTGQTKHLGLEGHAGAGRGRHRLLACKGRPHHRADSGNFILRLQDCPAIFPNLAVEKLHDLTGGRDGVSRKEGAARKNRRRRAHVVAVGQELRAPALVRDRQLAVLTERMRVGKIQSRLKSPHVSLHHRGSFPGKFLAYPRQHGLAPDPEPTRQQPGHDDILRLVRAGILFRHFGDWDADCH